VDVTSDGVAVIVAHPLLPESYQSVYSSLMPFYAHLFRICPTGAEEARTFQGYGVGHLEDIKM